MDRTHSPDTPSSWFEDDATFAAVVREALRDDSPTPGVPGCSELREIGRGGQGVVYAAVQTATRRRVAIKVLTDAPGRTRSARMRFERELELVASLHDPRLVQIFDGGTTDDGRPFVVMELVDGVRIDESPLVLAARASGFARPAADPVVSLFADVCEGLDHAHRRGVIHRDLKPSNIFVDPTGTPRVLDFGLAKAAGLAGEGFATTTGARFVGSLPWTSPEQAGGRLDAVDVRSDVYALGATLYNLVTGRPPCPTDLDLRRALDAVIHDSPTAPARLDPRCDRDLEAVILRALEKDPDKRYPTAGEMGRDLRRILAGEPLDARRDNAWRTLVKLAKRRRRLAIGASILAVAAVAVFITTWSLWRRAVSESRRAEDSLAFFLDAIGSVDPARDGADAKLADALDRVSADLDRRLGDDERDAKLKFRIRLRDLYIRLARYDRALAEAEAVVALQRGVEHAPGSAESRSYWNGEVQRGLILHNLRRDRDALPVYKASYEGLRAGFGDADGDALGALAGMGQVLKGLGQFDDAERALREVMRFTDGQLQTERQSLSRALAADNLSAIAGMFGRFDEAEQHQRETLRLFTLVQGEMGPDALGAESNLGSLLANMQRYADAERVLASTVTKMKQRFGARHPMTLTTIHSLGVALSGAGRLPEADTVLREAYEGRVAALGADASDTLSTLNELALSAERGGKLDEAERLLQLRLESGRRVMRTQPLDGLSALSDLGWFLCLRGRPGDARPLFEELCTTAAGILPPGHWLNADYSANYARCLTDLEQFDQAAERLKAAHAALSEKLGPNDGRTTRISKLIDRNARRRTEAATRPSSRP